MMNLFSLEFEKQTPHKHSKNPSTKLSARRAPFWVHLEVGQDLFGDWILHATKRSRARRVQCLSHRVMSEKSGAQDAVKGFLAEAIALETTAFITRCTHLDYHEDENLFAWVPGDFPIEFLKLSS